MNFFMRLLFTIILIMSSASYALGAGDDSAAVKSLMTELRAANKKAGWNPSIYNEDGWRVHGQSVQGRALIYFECGDKNPNTTLMLSSVHGDEVTPVYFGLRLVSWVKGEPDLCQKYHVVIAPLINPDGYLAKKMTRMNVNGVDLNRNFPTKDFDHDALRLWKAKFNSDSRRYPGEKGGSEPETRFQTWLIETFKPSKILTVHSPLNFYDYDGPEDKEFKQFSMQYIKSCDDLRQAVKKASTGYKFIGYGFFPGSLGNYAGKERGIPTLTLELPTTNAGRAKGYFEQLKKGTRELVMYEIRGSSNPGSNLTEAKQ
jgi:murein peptide amidase A